MTSVEQVAPRSAGKLAVKLRLLAACPLPLAAAAVLLLDGLGLPGQQDLFLRLEGTLVKAIGAVGTAIAALAFARGARLRLAWGAVAASYALLALKTCPVLGDDLLVARVGTLAANLLAPLGSFLMVRAWYGSGLTPAIPALHRRALLAVTFAVALVVAGPGVVVEARNTAHDPLAVLWVFSGIGDIATMTLLAPLVLIAMALRGNRLAWPMWLLAAGQACWLLYDLASSLGPELITSAPTARAISEVMRGSACLFHAGAGLAQRLVLDPTASVDRPSALQPR